MPAIELSTSGLSTSGLSTSEMTALKTCNSRLDEAPWAFDTSIQYGPGSSQIDAAPSTTPVQGGIPEDYRNASAAELNHRIRIAKDALGERLVVLGHFYQRDEVVEHADFIGDSFQLAREALSRPAADYIVFCGVHFMAETADVLTLPHQAVVLPNLAAGCSMADMADIDSVRACWAQLESVFGEQPAIPVTYMNSSAALKAFCGDNGGIVCTSSNAQRVLEWAFSRGERVLFFPDQHLGRNTAKHMGVPLSRMPLWDPRKALGGNTIEALHESRVLLWRGWCSVHKRFTVEQIAKARRDFPGVRVIVHPECPMDVVDAADEFGSTDYIRTAIENAPSGQTFAIGTEVNMVRRLARANPQLNIFCLDPVICPCSTMYRVHPAYLAWVTEALVAGKVVNQISVAPDIAGSARVALERMLEVAR